jgi:hypothetical protein
LLGKKGRTRADQGVAAQGPDDDDEYRSLGVRGGKEGGDGAKGKGGLRHKA